MNEKELFSIIQKYECISKEQAFLMLYESELRKMKDKPNYEEKCRKSFSYFCNSLLRSKAIKEVNDYLCLSSKPIVDYKKIYSLWIMFDNADDINQAQVIDSPFYIGFIKNNKYYQITAVEKNNTSVVPMIISSAKANEMQNIDADFYQYILCVSSYETAAEIRGYGLPDNYHIAVLSFTEGESTPKIDYI